MKTYVNAGDKITLAAPSGGVVSGQGALLGTHLFGVAMETADAGALFTLLVEGHVSIAKTSALAIAVGDIVYWNNGSKTVNKTASGNKAIGVATSDAANPSAMVNVRLMPNVTAIV